MGVSRNTASRFLFVLETSDGVSFRVGDTTRAEGLEDILGKVQKGSRLLRISASAGSWGAATLRASSASLRGLMALSQALNTRQLRFSIPNAHDRTNASFSSVVRSRVSATRIKKSTGISRLLPAMRFSKRRGLYPVCLARLERLKPCLLRI